MNCVACNRNIPDYAAYSYCDHEIGKNIIRYWWNTLVVEWANTTVVYHPYYGRFHVFNGHIPLERLEKLLLLK